MKKTPPADNVDDNVPDDNIPEHYNVCPWELYSIHECFPAQGNMVLMYKCLQNIVQIRHLLLGNTEQDTLLRQYNQLCYRLDCGALVLTQVANCAVLALWYIVMANCVY
jgi:hypothetical protein